MLPDQANSLAAFRQYWLLIDSNCARTTLQSVGRWFESNPWANAHGSSAGRATDSSEVVLVVFVESSLWRGGVMVTSRIPNPWTGVRYLLPSKA